MPSDDDSGGGGTTTRPQLVKGRFLFEDGSPMKDLYVYTDVPNNAFKVENRFKLNDKGEGGLLRARTRYNFYYTEEARPSSELNSTLTEADCELVRTGRVQSGKIEVKLTRRPDNKVLALRFKSDHNKLKENEDDWRNTGPLIEPEWKDGVGRPISHTMDKEIEVEVEISLKQAAKGNLAGNGPGDISIEGEIDAPMGTSKHTIKSKQKLPNEVTSIELELKWCIERSGADPIPLGGDTKNKVYVTMDNPREEGEPEDGATSKRMAKAVEWVSGAGTLEPHEIVDHCFEQFDHYVLGWHFLSEAQQEYLNNNPDVKQAMEDAGFATFTKSSVGGAWPLTHYNDYGGECQAMVRAIRGVLTQVGVPGEAAVKYVNCDARTDAYKARVRDRGTGCDGPDSSKRYALVDSRVDEGGEYDDTSGVGWNNYEAYMRFAHDGRFGWLGGGIGRLPDKQDPLNVFYGLAEFETVYASGTYKRKVTKLWNYREHDWAPYEG